MQAWDGKVKMAAKDLRNTIPTTALDEGWGGIVLERFLGHSPQTVTTKHYYGDEKERMLDLFREQVTSRIDRSLDSHFESRAQRGRKTTIVSESEKLNGNVS